MSELRMATTMVYWPGKSTLACDEHARALQNLASVLGFPLTCNSVLPETACENCKNEASK